MSISDTAKVRLLSNKLKTGAMSRADAENMLRQLESPSASGPFGAGEQLNRTRIKILRDFLGGIPHSGAYVPKQMDFTKGSDEHVARKYLQLKDNAFNRGIKFSLTLEDVRALLNATQCYYSGVWFDRASAGDKRTVDRVDNSKGYEPGNVVACLDSINRWKNEMFEAPGAPFHGNYAGLLKCVKHWGGTHD